jgi:hypothetical protein
VTDERIAKLMGWHWPTSFHPDDMLAKVRAVVNEAKRDTARELHEEVRNALDSADIKQRMGQWPREL